MRSSINRTSLAVVWAAFILGLAPAQAGIVLLLDVLERFDPKIVMTTSWLMFLERDAFRAVFNQSGLSAVSTRFHEHWEAPWVRNRTRRDAIDAWLTQHDRGEPYAILDDSLSGTGLKGSPHDKTERVIWCEVGVGLTETQLPQLERALSRCRGPEMQKGRPLP